MTKWEYSQISEALALLRLQALKNIKKYGYIDSKAHQEDYQQYLDELASLQNKIINMINE